MIAFTKRNLLLFFRDKATVFFSMLSVIILIGLYVLFLGDMTSNNLPDFPSKKMFINTWFLAGVLAVTSMTTTLGALGILVEDRSSNRYMDFYASPIARTKLIAGYIGSALLIGFIISLFTLVIANIFFIISGETAIEWTNFFLLCAVIFLSVTSSGAIVFFLVSFFKTSNAFAAASTVIGTLLGFLAGIYIPIGALPDYLQTVVKLFPVSHSASLYRQILMESSIVEAFADMPHELKSDFMTSMGVQYEFKGTILHKRWSVIYLIGTTIVFFVLSTFVLRKKNV